MQDMAVLGRGAGPVDAVQPIGQGGDREVQFLIIRGIERACIDIDLLTLAVEDQDA